MAMGPMLRRYAADVNGTRHNAELAKWDIWRYGVAHGCYADNCRSLTFREGARFGGPLRVLATTTQALQDAAVTGDRADQDRIGGDLGAGKDDALAQLRTIADLGAVAEHDRAHQAHAGSDAHPLSDPGRGFDLDVRRQRLAARDEDPRAGLLALDAQPQLAAQRVEGPLPELTQ